MSDNNLNNQSAASQGFPSGSSSTDPASAHEQPADQSQEQAAVVDAKETKASRNRIRADNLKATFGSGPGRLGLIAAAVVVVVFGALAASNFRETKIHADNSKVDSPTTPPNRVSTNAVTPEEAARRSAQSKLEAEEAHAKGQNYEPGFDYNIADKNRQAIPTDSAAFGGFAGGQSTAGGQAGSMTNSDGSPVLGAPEISSSSNSNSAGRFQGQGQQNKTPQQLQKEQQDQLRRDQEMQRATDRLAQEQRQAEAARDKYTEAMTAQILTQVGGLFNSQGTDSLNSIGSYSQSTYYRDPNQASGGSATERVLTASRNAAASKPVIKAGNTMYATLDSEANTDDGSTILATVRSGKWKGSKLIGQSTMGNNNVSYMFNLMAPQDNRSTMRIRAIALREDNAKTGMAENIDHHTLSRYSALAAAAILQGAGRVYQQPIGTTTITNGSTTTTVEQPRDRQVIGSAVGELGMSLGQEIRRRGFNQPSTYSTPAETGFTLYFLEDVIPMNANAEAEALQQAPLAPQVPQMPQMPQMPQAIPGFPGPMGQGGAYGFPQSNYGVPPYGYQQGQGNYDSNMPRNRGPMSGF